MCLVPAEKDDANWVFFIDDRRSMVTGGFELAIFLVGKVDRKFLELFDSKALSSESPGSRDCIFRVQLPSDASACKRTKPPPGRGRRLVCVFYENFSGSTQGVGTKEMVFRMRDAI